MPAIGTATKAPVSKPVQAPTSEVSDEPLSYPIINVEWAGVLIGLCQSMLHRRAWDGSEAEQDAAIQQAEELIYRLMNSDPPAIGGNAMAIGTIFPYFNALPSNALPCDFSLHEEVDYPDLYAVIDPSLQVDANHFRTPPNPHWNTPITRIYSASSASTSAPNLDDANLATTWNSTVAAPQWVEVNFNQIVSVTGYTLNKGTVAAGNAPQTFKLQVHLDGDWVDLDSRTGVTLAANTDTTYNFAAVSGMRFRLYITVPTGTAIVLSTFKLVYSEKLWKYGIVASEPA